MKNDNPWLSRFLPLLDEKRLRQLAQRLAEPIGCTKGLSREEIARLLREGLVNVFVCTDQCTCILQTLIEVALGHSRLRYPDVKTFIQRCYPDPEADANAKEGEAAIFSGEPPVICLTGAAGTGKTALLEALARVLSDILLVKVDEHHPDFPMEALWGVAVSKQVSIVEAIRVLCEGRIPKNGICRTLSKLVPQTRQLAYNRGVALLRADEFQHFTKSKSANALVTALLLRLMELSVPLLYAANYSLCHRLLKRPQEDTQRLVEWPIVLVPDSANSSDWIRTLEEYRKVAPHIFLYDPVADGQRIHSLTVGIKRIATRLLVLAYRLSPTGTVSMPEIEHAYKSTEFTANRRDVVAIKEQATTGRAGKRLDLWCPFDLPKEAATEMADQVKAERATQVAREALLSAMDAKERAALKVVEGQKGGSTGRSKDSTVIEMKLKGSRSSGALLKNMRAFEDKALAKK